MADNLLPCPFCGGKAKFVNFYGVYMVMCENCRIATDTDHEKEDVIKTWNTRTTTMPVGKWKMHIDEYEICATEFVCTNCNENLCTSELTDKEMLDMMKYCPNCGAKMGGAE